MSTAPCAHAATYDDVIGGQQVTRCTVCHKVVARGVTTKSAVSISANGDPLIYSRELGTFEYLGRVKRRHAE